MFMSVREYCRKISEREYCCNMPEWTLGGPQSSKLSQAYDMNPTPYRTELSLAINEVDALGRV